MDTRVAESAEQSVLAKVLVRAFEEDPVLRWILPSPVEYQRVSQTYFELVLKQSLSSKRCYTTDEQSGVSLWEEPDHLPSAGSQLLHFLRLSWLLRGDISRVLDLQSLMSSYRPPKPFWHLTYIATDPARQGKGIGASLMKPVTKIAREQNIPIYLECSNRANLSFYRAHGFRLVDEVSYPGGPTIWPMLLDR
ncbi:MAG: GNAT family N-acetyltransferase [bacterium]|nr:GNAT family N-acetyltransferase [Gammaproteobacteria bacterium]